MRKFTLHCFATARAAKDAFEASEIPGTKRASSLRIDSETEAHLFRKVVSKADAEQLAGMAFQAIHTDPATDHDARNTLQCLMRYV